MPALLQGKGTDRAGGGAVSAAQHIDFVSGNAMGVGVAVWGLVLSGVSVVVCWGATLARGLIRRLCVHVLVGVFGLL